MMSTRDFECKQIAFVFTSRGEKISFKNDNLLITDENGTTKHQSTCYRLFLLFICGEYCITSGLLDIGYTILFNVVNALLEMYGFDVYVGILHTQFFHRKSLVCDLEEPFRPIIDAALIKAMNLGQIDEKDFWKNQDQYVLPWKNSAPYIELFIKAIMKYKNEIFIYLQSYYRAFMRERDAEEFPVFEMDGEE